MRKAGRRKLSLRATQLSLDLFARATTGSRISSNRHITMNRVLMTKAYKPPSNKVATDKRTPANSTLPARFQYSHPAAVTNRFPAAKPRCRSRRKWLGIARTAIASGYDCADAPSHSRRQQRQLGIDHHPGKSRTSGNSCPVCQMIAVRFHRHAARYEAAIPGLSAG